MNPEDVIIEAYKREKEGRRGLRIVEPNESRAKGHLSKARHNLVVVNDLNKLGHVDWVLIASYYAMYHAALAVLHRIGLDSKEHATTVAVLEYFFVFDRKIDKNLLDRFNDVKEIASLIAEGRAVALERRAINAFWVAKRAREKAQYSIKTAFETKVVEDVISNARDFVTQMEVLIGELGEVRDYISGIQKKVKKLLGQNIS